MKEILTSATIALLVAGAAAVSAPGQQGTVRPGDIPRPDVWVSNHGTSEAVPVDLRDANLAQPLSVRVVRSPVTWEYRTAVVKPNDQLARTMTALGADGWETTGIAWPGGDAGTMVLLKRPR